ncbi:MAG TPA: hypothetical protein VJ694_00055 [Patescibacteria group bacterium]|nr:hypothetical protein [Patescibacteria group bacterium]
MNDLITYINENGVGLAVGFILGIGIIVALVIVVAIGDRRPPDKKDGP